MIEWQSETIAQFLRAAQKNLSKIKYRSNFGHVIHNWPLIELISRIQNNCAKISKLSKMLKIDRRSFAHRKRERNFWAIFYQEKISKQWKRDGRVLRTKLLSTFVESEIYDKRMSSHQTLSFVATFLFDKKSSLFFHPKFPMNRKTESRWCTPRWILL